MPVGVDAAPDRALGKFLAAQPGIVDVSGGHGTVFRGSLSDLTRAQEALLASRQFRRYSPATAAALGIQPHPPLVLFYLLTALNSPPVHFHSFNIA
jgi:hypothetical protein